MQPETFPRRTTRGLILGLSTSQTIVLGLATVVVLVVLVSSGVQSALMVGIPLVGFAGLAAFVPVAGRKIVEWVPAGLHFLWARLVGQNTYKARLMRPRDQGMIRLPGEGAALRLVEDAATSTAMVFDPHQRTLTAIALIRHGQFLSLPEDERDQQASAWGSALAHITSLEGVSRLQVLIRSTPDRGGELARAYERDGDSARSGSLGDQLYRELLERSTALMRDHSTYIAIQVAASKARDQVREAGGGIVGLSELLGRVRTGAEDALRGAGLGVEMWLPPSELARLIRVAYDPGAAAELEADPTLGVDASYTGPQAIIDEPSFMRADTGFFQVWTVNQWPRIATYAGFLRPLLMEPIGQSIFSLIFEPVDPDRAMSRAIREVAAEETARQERLKRGQVDTVIHARELSQAMAHLDDIAAGHGEVKMAAVMSVSGESMRELRMAGTRLKGAARKKNMDVQVAYLNQSNLFLAGALPLCRPL
ncbi:SCO6880 family protein [Trueperella pyogenes]